MRYWISWFLREEGASCKGEMRNGGWVEGGVEDEESSGRV